jgi:xanthine dehydrogenase accessory factor
MKLRERGVAFAVVTVIAAEGSTPRHVGTKMIVTADGAIVGTIGGGALESAMIEKAKAAIASGDSLKVEVALGPALGQCCGGRVELFVDPDRPADRLYLFGAGHVAQALCAAAAPLGFEVTVVDPRPDWNSAARFPAAKERLVESGEEALDHLPFDGRATYCAVMTHNHKDDEDIVRALLARPARYLGLIGSKTKWARFKQRYRERGLPDADVARVRCPIGLELGAETPAEIATAIAGELVKVRRARLALVMEAADDPTAKATEKT